MINIVSQIDALQEKINSLRPLKKEQREQIKEYYRIGLAYSSNALEGNSLTESETKIVIEDGLTVDGKPLRDHFEAVGHSQAYDFIYACAQEKGFNEDIIKKLHHLFYFRINEEYAGKYRDIKVAISGSDYELPKPNEIQLLMDHFVSAFGKALYQEHPVARELKLIKNLCLFILLLMVMAALHAYL